MAVLGLSLIILGLIILATQGIRMSQAFDALVSEVQQAKASMAKAADTIAALVAKIPSPENVVDPTAVVAATADLRAGADALDAAVAATTAPPAA